MAYQDVRPTVVDLPRETHLPDLPAAARRIAELSACQLRRALTLLDKAIHQLQPGEAVVHGKIREAVSLLREQIQVEAAQSERHGGLLVWQARKVRDYIDSHIAGPVLVTDLCVVIGRSEAHFSRSFKRTFGESPHAFVVRRRLELAARYMLHTDAPLSDIALRCGFTDQAHLCKHFRRSTGQTPAAWRRGSRTQDYANSVASVPGASVLAESERIEPPGEAMS